MRHSGVLMLRQNRVRKIALCVIAAVGLGFGGCETTYEDPFPRTDRVHWPIGLTVHPNGRFLYVVNSNFDTRYREDVGGTISVFDLETMKLLDGQGPYLPSFGGHIKLNGNATRAYVTARLDNQLVVLDVAPNGSAISCNGSSDSSECSLNRIPNTAGSPRIPVDPFGIDVATETLGSVAEIATAAQGDWVLTAGETSATYTATSDDSATKIAEELAVALGEVAAVESNRITVKGAITVTAPDNGEASIREDIIDIIGLSHLRSTNLTGISIRDNLATASMRSAEFLEGTNTVARRPGTRDFYAGGRFSRELAIFQPYLEPQGAVQGLVDRGRVTLNALTTAVDARAIAFEPDGNTLYVATRNPDALHVIEIVPQNAELGTGTAHRVVKAIALNAQPSDIVRAQINGRTLLYITCYDGQSIQVVDPQLGAIVDEIELGARPYIFATDSGPYCRPGADRCYGYVSLFDDMPRAGGSCTSNMEEPCGSIGVIDLNPNSSRYHQLIRKLY